MQTQKQRSTYQQLELIPTSSAQPHRYQIFSVFRNIWDNVLLILTIRDEPQIRQSIDAEGKLYWRIDDPRTGRSITCKSEQEVRRWLEQYFGSQQVQSHNYFAPHPFLDRFRS